MFRWLLMVSTDNKPELTVSTADNIKAIFEEYGAELWLMFFLGIISGIIISVIYIDICNAIKRRRKKQNQIQKNEQYESDE